MTNGFTDLVASFVNSASFGRWLAIWTGIDRQQKTASNKEADFLRKLEKLKQQAVL